MPDNVNIILVLVLAVFAVCLIVGYVKGFLRILFSLISGLLLMAVMSYAAPQLNTLIKENTGIHAAVSEKCADILADKMGDTIGSSLNLDDLGGMVLPAAAGAYLLGDGTTDILDSLGVLDSMADKAADLIITGVCFVVTLILSGIIVSIIGKSIGIVDHIPVLSGLNRILGLATGAVIAILIIWVAFLIIALISTTDLGTSCLNNIVDNPILNYLYTNNELVEIILK